MMRVLDVGAFASHAILRYRVRSGLMLLAMAIGVAAVIVLTSLGEGARRYVVGEFASLGTNLLIVLPGRSETTGAGAALFVGETPRDLTLDDAQALTRHRQVKRVAPLMVGSVPVAWSGREREVPVLGSNSEFLDIRHWSLAQGRFLPPGDLHRASAVCVIGAKVKRELFGAQPALGEWLRVGERRFRIIGVLGAEGRSIGVDVEELVIIPVAAAQQLYNSPSLFRILIEVHSREALPAVKTFVTQTLTERHQGEEDVTVITQDAVLSTFDRILRALTLTVAGIGAISLAVAGILIMNIMLVAVSQRTTEIGLLKAIGAPRTSIIELFLVEAGLLALTGALLGTLIGYAVMHVITELYPALPGIPPWWAVAAAIGVALLTGIAFGVMPARRAANLDPVQALARR
ncbi:MAG: ABC transporter permease [Granulosicoccaceae bacterium]|jgi:putative ABC transport system permease protein